MSKLAWIAIAVLTLSSCGGSGSGGSNKQDAAEKEVSRLEIVADDFSFSLPKSVPSGPIEVELENIGGSAHQALTYRLNDGITHEEYVAAAIKDDSQVPAMSSRVGGVNDGIDPGASGVYSAPTPYEPGLYVVICFIREPDEGKHHLELGMIAPFTVE